MKSMLWKIPPILALAALAMAPGTAAAQTLCGKREAIVRQLESKYGETRRSLGLQQDRGVVEIFANTDSGSWTILFTDTNGRTCLMAAGQAYQAVDPEAAGAPV